MNEERPVVLIVARDDSPGARIVATNWNNAVPDTHEAIWATSLLTGRQRFEQSLSRLALVIVTDYLSGGYSAGALFDHIQASNYTGPLVIVNSTRKNVVAGGNYISVGEGSVPEVIQTFTTPHD